MYYKSMVDKCEACGERWGVFEVCDNCEDMYCQPCNTRDEYIKTCTRCNKDFCEECFDDKFDCT